MYVCICMYVCMYVCSVRILICMYLHINTYVCKNTRNMHLRYAIFPSRGRNNCFGRVQVGVLNVEPFFCAILGARGEVMGSAHATTLDYWMQRRKDTGAGPCFGLVQILYLSCLEPMAHLILCCRRLHINTVRPSA